MKKLSQTIIRLLKKKKLNISFAESCTGGMLSSAITSISGSSKVYSLGLVTYSNQSKKKLLNVSNKTIKKHGAVSAQCCFSMVNNLSKISKSNLGERVARRSEMHRAVGFAVTNAINVSRQRHL